MSLSSGKIEEAGMHLAKALNILKNWMRSSMKPHLEPLRLGDGDSVLDSGILQKKTAILKLSLGFLKRDGSGKDWNQALKILKLTQRGDFAFLGEVPDEARELWLQLKWLQKEHGGFRFEDRDMKATLYGIPNCNQMKKARELFGIHGVEFEEVNFKKAPPTVEFIKDAYESVGGDLLINRKGTTYRLLNLKEVSYSDGEWIQCLQENPSLMKRPLVRLESGFVCGVDNLASALEQK